MTKFPIAAAALLFGTSAFAMVPSTQPTSSWVDKDPYSVSSPTFGTGTYAAQPAAVDWWGANQHAAYTPAADTSDVAEDEAAIVEDEPALEPAVADVEPAAYETTAVDEAPIPVENGVGGPEVDTAALSPRPAAQNYPACRPGRGDDNCIQLYERGVREQLASWDQPTGGFAGAGETQTAMGGPYEPAPDSASETERLNQQALADSSAALQQAQLASADAVAVHEHAYDNSAIDETARVDDSIIVTDENELAGV